MFFLLFKLPFCIFFYFRLLSNFNGVSNHLNLYYFDSNETKFEKCSDNCVSCESKSKCLECESGYFLNFNSPYNYSCAYCSEFYNCSTCTISNITREIGYRDFDLLNSIEEYKEYSLLYKWEIVCSSCKASYFRKENSKCYKCSDEISDCMECIYLRNNNNFETLGSYFPFCLSCNNDKNQVVYMEKTTNFFSTTCEVCYSLIPHCKNCEGLLIKDVLKIDMKSLSYLMENSLFEFSFFSEATFQLRCLDCDNNFIVKAEEEINSCQQCPDNCETCYYDSTLLCGRCQENYVLSIYEGRCYQINSFNNITDEYKDWCLRIISENPWASYFSDSSLFLCQKCKDPALYPSINGKCLNCLDSKCSSCNEIYKGNEGNSISLTDKLLEFPLSILKYITSTQTIESIQKCVSCISAMAFDSSNKICCAPSAQIMTANGMKTFIAGCESCENCFFVDNTFNDIGCITCKKCANLSEKLLNDDNYIRSVNYLSPYYGKKIYYYLMTEGNTFNTTPPLNETEIYKKIYESLSFQNQVDLLGNSIYQCTACPINAINCKKNMIPNIDYFKSDTHDLYSMLSYLLAATKCREHFIYENNEDYARCKFCPNNWKNCKAYKIIEKNFSTSSTFTADIIGFIKNLEYSEFAYICNEFSVKKVEIHVILDTDSALIWKNFENFQSSLILEGTLKLRVPSLEEYEILFIPKNYSPNTYSTIKLDNHIIIQGFTAVKFMNIVFKSDSQVLAFELDMNPCLEINSYSIFFNGCSLIFETSLELILMGSEISSNGFFPSLIFSLNGEKLQVENFQVRDIPLKIPAVLSNIYSIFQINCNQAKFKNLIFRNLTLENLFSVINLKYAHPDLQSIENLQILNCTIKKSVFFWLGTFTSLNMSLIFVYNTTILKLPLLSSLISMINNVTIFNLKIEKSIFMGINNVNSIINSNDFYNISDCIIKESYFFRTTMFYFIDTLQNNGKQFFFRNIVLLNNTFEKMEEIPFLVSIELLNLAKISLHLENIVLENNNLILIKKTNGYAMEFLNIDLVFCKNIVFINNFNISGFYIENLNSVEFSNISFVNKFIDETQDQIGFFIMNTKNSIKLGNLNFHSLYSETGIVRIEETKFEMTSCLVYLINSFIQNIFIRSFSFASCFFIRSVDILDIHFINNEFLNLILDDQSDHQESSTAIYIESSFSSSFIEGSSFRYSFSNGQCNLIRVFINNFTLSKSNLTLANYIEDYNKFGNIINQGSFINGFLANIILNCTIFSKSYALNGGAAYINFLNKKASVTIVSCIFEKLFSISEGGAFFLSKNNEKEINFLIENCTFHYISALINGGVFLIKTFINSKLVIQDSKFYNIHSSSGCLLSTLNLEIKFTRVNISENYKVFSEDSVGIIFNLNENDFLSDLEIGSLINLKNGRIVFLFCNIFNLTSATHETEATILYCQSCQFYDEQSTYANIFFWKSAFIIRNGRGSVSNSSFFNIKNQYFSKKILMDGIFLAERQQYYSATFLFSDSNFNFSYIKIELNECKGCLDGGGFLYSFLSEIKVEFSNFRDGSSFSGLLCLVESNLTVNCSLFEGNTVEKDGAVLLSKESEIKVLNCVFLKNSAPKGSGGVIFFYSEMIKTLTIIGSVFSNNIALIGGAIFYQKVAIYIDSLTEFKNNKALLYGSNYYSFPYSLCFVYLNTTCIETIPRIENFRSGAYLNKINLKLLDEEGNMIIRDNMNNNVDLTITLKPFSEKDQDSYSMNHTNKINGLQLNDFGLFSINDLLLRGKPETEVKLVFSSPIIMFNSSTFGIKSARNYSISLILHFRNCSLGEYYQLATETCFLCLAGTYSFHPIGEECKNCPQGLVCEGGAESIVLPGYWRSEKYSEKIIYCSSNPYNCFGGKDFQNKICFYGHIGAKCESCDLMGHYWNTSFGRTSEYECAKCDEIVYNYIFLVFLTLFSFFSMTLSIKGTIENLNRRLKLKVIRRLARFSMLSPKKNESSIYLKIYFSYVQIIQALKILNLSYSNEIISIGASIGAPTNSALYSTDCLVAKMITTIPYIHVKLIVALMIPLVYLFLFILGYFLYMRRSKFHHKYSILYTVFLFILIYFQPNMIDNAISVLSCVQVGDEKYIKADLAYTCNGDEYYFYSFAIGIPSLFFWGFGTPLTILYRLIRNRKNLDSIPNKIRYGYLYDEYTLFYWEFIRMYEKILITVVISFFDFEIFIKCLLILLIIGIYILLLFKKNPYKTKKLNRADKFNNICCYLSIFLGMLTYKNTANSLVNFSYCAILIINIIFNIYIWKSIIGSYTNHFQETIEKILNKLIQRSPNFVLFKSLIPQRFNPDSKWLTLRRLVSKYLREKERFKSMRFTHAKTDLEKYKLSFIEYGLNNIKKCHTKAFSNDEEDFALSMDEQVLMTEKEIRSYETNFIEKGEKVFEMIKFNKTEENVKK